jgi:hypothetical protein
VPVTNRDIVRAGAELHRSVIDLRTALHSGALQRMEESAAGLTAQRFDRLAQRGSHSDSTAMLAQRETDMAGAHRAELVGSITTALLALSRCLELAALYPPPHVADEEDRAALARINGRAEPGCQNCARLTLEDGQRRWEPIDPRLSEATTVGQRLTEALLLCSWCVDRTRAWGRLPTPEELRRHHAGQRVPWPDDVERPK